jgi:hypothetical protein
MGIAFLPYFSCPHGYSGVHPVQAIWHFENLALPAGKEKGISHADESRSILESSSSKSILTIHPFLPWSN